MWNVSAVAGGVGRDCSSGTSFVVCGPSASIVFMNNVSSWASGVSALDCGMLSSTSASLLPLRIVVVNLCRYLRIWPRRPCSKAESRGGDGGIPDRLVGWYSWGSPIKLLSDGDDGVKQSKLVDGDSDPKCVPSAKSNQKFSQMQIGPTTMRSRKTGWPKRVMGNKWSFKSSANPDSRSPSR